MFKKIDWLFFDIGSTLIDETAAYEHRLKDLAQAAGREYGEIFSMAVDFYRRNEKGDLMVAKSLNLRCPPWYIEDERPYPDAGQCLAALHERYSIGIIANQEPGLAARLEKHQWMQDIDLVISSAEAGVAKPDRRIFELALNASGCAPERAVMIGDRIDNDVVPAKRLGMKTIWIRQGFGKYWNMTKEEEQPDCSVCSLTELCTLLINGER